MVAVSNQPIKTKKSVSKKESTLKRFFAYQSESKRLGLMSCSSSLSVATVPMLPIDKAVRFIRTFSSSGMVKNT